MTLAPHRLSHLSPARAAYVVVDAFLKGIGASYAVPMRTAERLRARST
ncbi:hypothetical protein ACFXDH_13545 [Streptomyces sp. NPDC059467]